MSCNDKILISTALLLLTTVSLAADDDLPTAQDHHHHHQYWEDAIWDDMVFLPDIYDRVVDFT